MGNNSSKEEQFGTGHPARFYDGCAAVLDGTYTNSEIFFNQAMTSHPGHAFWTRLMDVAIAKQNAEKEPEAAAGGAPAAVPSPTSAAAAASLRKSQSPNPGTLPTVLVAAGEMERPVFRDGDAAMEGERDVADSSQATSPPQSPPAAATTGEDANMSLNGSAAELDSKPTLVLPVDHRLADVQDYVRMLTDIGRIYRRKAADSTGDSREMSCRLSMLYNAYTAVRLQALLTVFRGHFAALNTSGDARAEDMFQIYAQRSMNKQWENSAAFRTEANHAKSGAGLTDVNSSSRNPIGKAAAEDHSHDGALCIFWQFMTFLHLVNVLSYSLSALRLMHVSDYNMSPATQRAVVEMALQCFESAEEQLSRIAEANSHMYAGSLVKHFLAVLVEVTKECHPKEEAVPKFGTQRRGKGVQRTVKELVPKFLRLGTPNLATRQQSFLRTAMHFPVMTLPLLDPTKMMGVELTLVHSGNRHHPVELMTPQDRSYPWYMCFTTENALEKRAPRPGESTFLLQQCGVPPKATLKDPSLFACVGMEELGVALFPLALGTATILYGLGQIECTDRLGKATYQHVVDLYGGTTPLSESLKTLFEHLDEDVTS